MPQADGRLQVQIDLILDKLHGSAAFPPNWRTEVGEVDYLYREGCVLVRDADVRLVVDAIHEILRSPAGDGGQGGSAGEAGGGEPEDPVTVRSVIVGASRVSFPVTAAFTTPVLLDMLDEQVGVGRARPEYVLFVSPHACPASEPEEVPAGTVDPFPAPGGQDCACECPSRCSGRARCDGAGVLVSVVDTGLLAGAAQAHSWLKGVTGDVEDPLDGQTGFIRPYAGHGTFVAGCVRTMAPKAEIYVDGEPLDAGADYEVDLLPQLIEALDRSPDVIVFTFVCGTRNNDSITTLDALFDSRIRHMKGLAFVVPAGNDGTRDMTWPAAYPWTISVGALSANWRTRADFSNFGGWVDVFAPGEDLVNAYASGTFECIEPPNATVARTFTGMAKWSGTSFSTPLVAGMIAARMSATGENGQQAAESLLRLARRHSLPGTGAVLLPGQACCHPPCSCC